MLEWRPGGGSCTAETAAPRTSFNHAKDIPIIPYIFILVKNTVNDFVAPASNDFSADAATTYGVVFMNARGCIEVPCNDEAITTACTEVTLRTPERGD